VITLSLWRTLLQQCSIQTLLNSTQPTLLEWTSKLCAIQSSDTDCRIAQSHMLTLILMTSKKFKSRIKRHVKCAACNSVPNDWLFYCATLHQCNSINHSQQVKIMLHLRGWQRLRSFWLARPGLAVLFCRPQAKQPTGQTESGHSKERSQSKQYQGTWQHSFTCHIMSDGRVSAEWHSHG